jgi:ATP-dependent exoDNAse (exonuclease V) beta subunit
MPKPAGRGGARPSDRPGADDESRRHPTFDWATDLQRRVGIVVHAMLQRMPARAMSDFVRAEETVRAALASEGVGGDKMEEAARRVAAAIRNTLEDQRGRWILEVHEDDRREFPISSVTDGQVRRYVLDRTFVDDGFRWIIDYKTGIHQGPDIGAFLDNEQLRYRAQLEEYARAMRTVDARPVRLGLYFPLLRGWREWAFEEPGTSVDSDPAR